MRSIRLSSLVRVALLIAGCSSNGSPVAASSSLQTSTTPSTSPSASASAIAPLVGRWERAPPTSRGTPPDLHLLDVGGCRLFQEAIPHWAAAVELVDHYRWGKAPVQIESARFRDLPTGAVDLIVYEEGGQGAYIAGEAKETAAKLDKLIRHIEGCTGTPARGHSRSEHWKCRALEEFEPNYFFGVAAGTRRAFEVHDWHGAGRRLEEVSLDRLIKP